MKPTCLLALLLVLLLPLHAADAPANQEDICYSQCAAYRLVWMDDYCWATFQHFCSMDKKDVGVQMVSAWASYVTRGLDFTFLVSAYMCVELVDECIRPILDECRASCSYDGLSYAPNLYVHSASYIKDTGKLYVAVRNNGRAYMPASKLEIYKAEANDYDPPDSAFSLMARRDIPELRPHTIRYVALDIPSEQSFMIDWAPVEGKYNVARIVIKAEPGYEEMSIRDNTYDYAVNNLPTPPYFVLGKPHAERLPPATDRFMVYVPIENQGQTSMPLTVEFYMGKPSDGDLLATQSMWMEGETSRVLEQAIRFDSPKMNYVTIVFYSQGQKIAETVQHAYSKFLLIRGKITDEAGNPLPDVRVSRSMSPSSPYDRTTRTDSRGYYEFSLLPREGAINIYAETHGHFPNQTRISFEYPEVIDYKFDYQETVRVDLSLLRHPGELWIGYPTQGSYIVETDRGRYTGPFVPRTLIPVQGINGTIAVFSPLCSPMIMDILISFPQTTVEALDVKCLTPSSGDGYTLLSAPELVFEKSYPGEIPRLAFFDKRGDHVYVITTNEGVPLCNIYSYSLPGGQQIYKKELNSYCLQTSSFIPSYDGSKLYAAIGVPNKVSAGSNTSTSYMFSESGDLLDSWEHSRHTTDMGPATATEFLDLLAHPYYVYRGEKIEACMLSEGQPCKERGTGHTLKSLGIAGHRSITTCGSGHCVVTLGHDDYVELPDYAVNSIVEGNYLNSDLFVGSYKGGYYLSEGQVEWEVEGGVSDASMSPGGSYVLAILSPYRVAVFDSSGNEHSFEGRSITGAKGIGATERGLFYAATKEGSMGIYRLSTLSEPQSGIEGEQATENIFYMVTAVFQALVDAFNALIELLTSPFSGT